MNGLIHAEILKDGIWMDTFLPGLMLAPPARVSGTAVFRCAQQGIVAAERTITVRLPPMVRSGTRLEVPLAGPGVHNLFLRLHVFVGD